MTLREAAKNLFTDSVRKGGRGGVFFSNTNNSARGGRVGTPFTDGFGKGVFDTFPLSSVMYLLVFIHTSKSYDNISQLVIFKVLPNGT